MSADFWAGYISGAAGILIGNPLDLIKVRLQASSGVAAPPPTKAASALTPPSSSPSSPVQSAPFSATAPVGVVGSGQSPAPPPPATTAQAPAGRPFARLRALATGTAAPVLGYGALNALLFVSYNRTESLLNSALSNGQNLSSPSATGSNLWTTWIAGAVGGLATWVVSTPTEIVKCRAQLSSSSSWGVAKQIWRAEGGVRGFYFGGAVTALRDSVGYGFYFWSYELCSRWMEGVRLRGERGQMQSSPLVTVLSSEAAQVLLCGGVAGVITWASIFPLDTIKTRMQAQQLEAGPGGGETRPLLPSVDRQAAGTTPVAAVRCGVTSVVRGKTPTQQRLGAVEIARQAYREGGASVFFRGLTVCSVRAFIVNAAQWAVYEWIMQELGQGRKQRASSSPS